MAVWHKPPIPSWQVVPDTGRSSSHRSTAPDHRGTAAFQPHRLVLNSGGRAFEIGAIVPSLAGGTLGGRRSSAVRPGRYHHRVLRSADGDDGTHAHNTLSTDGPDVQVFYPFHPLHGTTLQILRRPKRGDGAVCVMDPAGRRLKIPVWMLSRDCAEIHITERPHLSKKALLSLAASIGFQLDGKDPVHDNLLQTAVDRRKGGRGATKTSGPDDPKGIGSRATGRSGTRRSDRSHGPRSGRDLSRRERKSR